ncbi:MAG: Cellulosome protein dockerin type I, partial [Parcubacteria group bacterium GW2011_GWA2_47_12]
GKIDNADVIIVRKQILGKFQLESGPLANADVNGKDGVTTLDITFLRRYLLGLDATFPGCTTTSAQPSITVVSPNGGETWKIGEQRTVQLTVSGAPTSSYLQVSLVNGPTPIDIRAFTGPSGTISFDYSLPTTGCFTDYCHNLTPGEYKVQAVLYDKQPCNMRFPCTAEKFITSDLSNVPFTITATVSAPTQPVVTTTSSTTVGKPLICGSLGDVNNDGFVTADDKELTRTFILGTATPTDAQKVAADVNKSDSITSLDLTFIQRYVDGLSATLPGCPVAN